MTLLPDSVTLTVVDEGAPFKTYAPQLTQKLGLTSRVAFTGKFPRKVLRRFYTTSEVVVLPSLYEGFGLPAAESMACGTPVVATRAGALPEVVGEEGAGILVPPRDPQALAAAILKVLQDEASQKKNGGPGQATRGKSIYLGQGG